MASKTTLLLGAIVLIAVIEALWLLRAEEGRGLLPEDEKAVVKLGGVAVPTPGGEWEEGIMLETPTGPQMQFYWAEDEQPVVGPMEGNIVLIHMGRCGSTLVQRYITFLLFPGGEIENVMEVLQEAKVLPAMRKFLEVSRRGDTRDLERLEEQIGLRYDPDEFRLDSDDPLAIYDPGMSLQFDEMSRRSEEEYRALVYAMRLLTAVPANTNRVATLNSVKIWSICGVGFPVDQYLEALHEAGMRHVVVFHRNYLRRLLSSLAADINRVWHVMLDMENKNCKQPVEVNVHKQQKCDPGRTHSMTDLFELADSAYREIFVGTGARLFPDAVVVSYENDIYSSGGGQALRKIARHFGIDTAPLAEVRDLYTKTTDCALGDVIENFDEVTDMLVNTRWQYCLELGGGQEVVADPIQLVIDPPRL